MSDDDVLADAAEDSEGAQREYAAEQFFLRSLEEDVQRCRTMLVDNIDDEFAQRTYVRTVFAEVEGLCARAIAMARWRMRPGTRDGNAYSEAERTLLAGMVRVDERGQVHLQQDELRLETRKTIRFALNLIGRGAKHLPAVECDDGGWEALSKAISIRDRLMHPKEATDLLLSEQELVAVRNGHKWFLEIYRAREQAYTSETTADWLRKFGEWLKTEEGQNA